MIDHTAFGASLMAALTVGTGFIRWAVTPTRTNGRHRAHHTRAVLADASLNELLGAWPNPVPGAACTQAWHDCPHCAKTTAGVVTRDGFTCGECLTPPVTEPWGDLV